LRDAKIHDRVKWFLGRVFKKMFAYHSAWQGLFRDQPVDITLGFLGDRQRGDVHATLTSMFSEGAPSRADVQHAPARLNPARFDRGIQLAPDRAPQRLVVALEISVRTAAMLRV